MSSRGGGDIYISEHNSSPLVVVVPDESAPQDKDSPGDQNLQATGDAPKGSAMQL